MHTDTIMKNRFYILLATASQLLCSTFAFASGGNSVSGTSSGNGDAKQLFAILDQLWTELDKNKVEKITGCKMTVDKNQPINQWWDNFEAYPKPPKPIRWVSLQTKKPEGWANTLLVDVQPNLKITMQQVREHYAHAKASDDWTEDVPGTSPFLSEGTVKGFSYDFPKRKVSFEFCQDKQSKNWYLCQLANVVVQPETK
jgi:hypothetical protein